MTNFLRTLISLSLALTLLLGCGGSGTSNREAANQNTSSQGGLSQFPDFDSLMQGGSHSSLPGIGQNSTGNGNSDSSALLASLLDNLSNESQQEVILILEEKIDDCDFFTLRNSAPNRRFLSQSCLSGNAKECVSNVGSLATTMLMGFVDQLGESMPLSGTMIREGLAEAQGLCASLSSPQQIQSKAAEKLQQCKKGDLKACIGMFMLFLKNMFMGLVSSLLG